MVHRNLSQFSKPLVFVLFLGTLFLFLPDGVHAVGINPHINFHGKVVNKTSGTNVTDDEYEFVFKLYNTSSGGSEIWSETQALTVTDGIFRAALGSVTSFESADVNFNNENLYLEVTFNGEVAGTRIRFSSVPYAMNAEKVNGLTVTNTSDAAFTNETILKIGDGKTVVFTNGLTFSGTDSTTFTFPNTSGTVATLDLAQTFTNKTIGSTGLTFSGASTDITTGTDEDLTLVGNGTGIISLNDTVQISTLTNSKGLVYLDDASGTLTSLANGTTGDCLKANTSAAPSWGTCGASGGSANWILNSTDGTLTSINNTLDLLLGGTASTSAKFSILNMTGSGTPTASVSATTTGNAIYLSGDGTIQTARKRDLTLGGDTTGALRFYSHNTHTMTLANGNVGIGTTDPTTPLRVSGTGNTASNGSIFLLNGSLTGTAGGQYGARFIPSVSPSSASTRTYAAAEFGPTSSSNNLENASFVGFIGKPYYSGTGTVGTVVGGDFYYELDGSGTIDSGFGVYIEDPAKSGGTINNNRGLQIDAQTSGTSNVGLVIGEATGTRNTNLLIGTTSQPVGSWSIYNSSPDENYFGGNLGIGVSTSISGKLHIMSNTVTDLMRIGYDASNYFSAQVSSAGAVTFNAVGGSAGFAFSDPMTLGIAGSVNGSLTFHSSGAGIDPATITMDSSGNLTIQATQTGASLILGDGTGDIRFTPGTDNIVMNLNSTGDLLIQDNGTTYAIFNDSGNVGFGTTTPTSQLFVTRPLTFGATGKALAVFDQIENQDILTASASGTPRFTITKAGGIKLGTDEGSSGNCLLSGGAGAAATWGSCGSGGGAPNTKNTSGSGDVSLTTSETSLTSLAITPSSASNEILVIAKMTAYSATTQDRTTTLRIRRGANCSATQVGSDAEAFSTNSTSDDNLDIYAARIDAPATTGSTTYQLCAVTTGTNIGAAYWELTLMEVSQGADYAELYNTNDTSLSQGDVVVLDQSLVSGVKKSSKVYDASLIGIVSTRPNMVIGAGDRAGVNAVPIALAGRVPVKVSTENGLIRPGDFLTSSSVPGVAMKATKAGWVIGQAMTGFEGSNTGEIMAFVKTSWFDPGTDFSGLEGLTIVSDVRNHEDRIAELEKLFASQSIQTSSVSTLTVKINGNEATFVSGDEKDTTIAQDRSGRIREVLTATESANSVQRGSSDQKLISTADEMLESIKNGLSSSSKNNDRENLLGVNYIDTFSARQATISANFRVQGDSLFEGILSVIESITTHNLYVSGIAHFFGEVVFKDRVFFTAAPTFTQDTAGYVVIPKGQTSVVVTFDIPYEEEPIISAQIISAAFSDETFNHMVVTKQCMKEEDKTECRRKLDLKLLHTKPEFLVTEQSRYGFTILMAKEAATDYTFSWNALAIKKAQKDITDIDKKSERWMEAFVSTSERQ